MIDDEKQRREFMRWVLLLGLYNAAEMGLWEHVLLNVVQSSDYADATKVEVRRHLDYLEERHLVKVDKHPDGRWFAKINRHGVDIVEYTVEVEPGIARPPKP